MGWEAGRGGGRLAIICQPGAWHNHPRQADLHWQQVGSSGGGNALSRKHKQHLLVVLERSPQHQSIDEDDQHVSSKRHSCRGDRGTGRAPLVPAPRPCPLAACLGLRLQAHALAAA